MRITHVTPAVLVGALLVVAVASVGLRAADKTRDAPTTVADGEASVLVLQDGGVLAGQITRAADWYIVSRDGGQIQVEKSRVKLVGRSLEEAYEIQRQQLSGQEAEPHLSLAEWCLRYNLLADAGRELAAARQIDPDQPRLALLDRRLATIKAQLAETHRAVSGVKTPARAANPTPPIIAHVAELPDGVVERFTRKVQPVLVNDCTTSGCHQPGGAQSFQLDRALLRGESNRRTTLHNLKAALALVNREHPEQSLLLTIPRKPHGGMAGPIIGPRQEQAYKHLIDWVALIAPPAPQPTDEPPNANDQQTKTTPPEKPKPASTLLPVKPVAKANLGGHQSKVSTGNPSTEKRPAKSSAPSPVQPAAAIEEDAPHTLRPPQRLQYGVQLERWQPRDAFDPEIFNRQQRRQNKPVSASAAQPTASEKR
jgi:hypothetical protein